MLELRNQEKEKSEILEDNNNKNYFNIKKSISSKKFKFSTKSITKTAI